MIKWVDKWWLLIIIIVGESLLTGLIPHTEGHLFGLLELRSSEVWVALFLFGLNLFLLHGFQSFKAYIILKTALLFRTEKTVKIASRKLNIISSIAQRIQEDIKLNFLSRYTVFAEYFISGTIVIQLIALNLKYPLLICTALIYAAVSVAIAILFNPKLTKAEKSVQEAEAAFRTQVGNSCQEVDNKAIDITLLGATNNVNLKAAAIRLQYTLFTQLQLVILSVVPFIALLPGYLAGHLGLGEVMQHRATFSLIVVNAAILIQCYPTLIQGRASKQRVAELLDE
jgi:ABC-type uncharacterized transport system fused permease/ATPase subunit